jgi:transposase
MSGYWAKAPQSRSQLVLFTTTLDDRIGDDHPVRLLAEILERVDWSQWEAEYDGRIGQPPIHPRILAGLWLYALRRGFRSSRKLEYFTRNNIDFIWLAEGHTPDHSTLSDFRTKFGKALRGLFRQVAHIALTMGFLQLVDVANDGTRVKAQSNRFETWTAERIAKALDELTAAFEKSMAQSQAADDQERQGESTETLPKELASLQARREKLEAIQQQLAAMDAARKREGTDPKKSPAQIPKHDPDARVLPNKEGGYAPNYTPIATTEGHGGYIVDADVIASTDEAAELVPSIDRVTESLGEKPANVLADGLFATGENITELEARQIDFYSNLTTPSPAENPALRPDPTQPVPEEQWPKLPTNPHSKTLDKSAFVYDDPHDAYYCPLGQRLDYEETKSETRRGKKISRRVYRCSGCAGCPLAARCLLKSNTAGRTVNRDSYTKERERLAVKMQTAEAQKKYHRRMAIAETPFALLKHIMGLRQFLLRGLEQVKQEWRWACLAVNVDKLVRDIQRVRGMASAMIAAEAV